MTSAAESVDTRGGLIERVAAPAGILNAFPGIELAAAIPPAPEPAGGDREARLAALEEETRELRERLDGIMSVADDSGRED